eukprot:scaffold13896_cov120-Isochrysis_galbana.AAC.3
MAAADLAETLALASPGAVTESAHSAKAMLAAGSQVSPTSQSPPRRQSRFHRHPRCHHHSPLSCNPLSQTRLNLGPQTDTGRPTLLQAVRLDAAAQATAGLPRRRPTPPALPASCRPACPSPCSDNGHPGN